MDFENVSFTYDEGTPAETKVLEHVNFKIKPGENIALVFNSVSYPFSIFIINSWAFTALEAAIKKGHYYNLYMAQFKNLS